MRILIIGSSGFIGSSLKNFLEKKKVQVICYDLKENPPNDVLDYLNLKSKMKKLDGIVHLAAVSRVKLAYENPKSCVEINMGGTVNVLEAARELQEKRHSWIIFGSSREVFGEARILPAKEESPKNPINIYGVAKLACEEFCKIYSKEYGLKIRVLGFSNVYTGKNDQLDRVIPKFILRAAKNKDLVIDGTGEETFDFTYISDAIQGIWGCIREIEKSEQLYNDFNLLTGKGASLKELAGTIIREMKSKSKIKYASARTYDVKKFYGDPKKAKNFLHFSPNIKLYKGIRSAIKEFRREKLI